MNELERDLENVLNEYIDSVDYLLKKYIREKGKVASGEFIKSIKYTIKNKGSEKPVIELDFINYGFVIDKGRRPGKYVPVKSLEKWMNIKNIPLKWSYPINRSIKMNGIKGIGWVDYFEKIAETEF